MRIENNGLALWYGTDDASAPEGEILIGDDITLMVGVKPMDANNKVEVVYSVNQGARQTISATWWRNDLASKTQYFRASFPALRVGDMVEYAIICRCAGKQVPDLKQAQQLENSFHVIAAKSGSGVEKSPQSDFLSESSSPNTPISSSPKESLPTSLDNSKQSLHTTSNNVISQQDIPPTVATSRAALSSGDRQVQNSRSISPTSGVQVSETVRKNPALPVIPNPTLVELSSKVGLDRQSGLMKELSDRGIKTLDDVRKAGGIGNLKNLSVTSDNPTIQKLDAQANLSVLSSDLEVNTKLIENGFTSIEAIATIPRASFIDKIGTDLDAHVAAKLHQDTQTQKAVLDNILTIRRLNAANNYPLQTKHSQQSQGGKGISLNDFKDISAKTGDSSKAPVDKISLPETQSCVCRDCDAAVSPRAYLADLLAYVVNYRISKLGERGGTVYLTLDDLVSTFHQPFDQLPASCDAVEQEVRQVRLCVEVLRQYLGNRPLTDTTIEEKLRAGEHDYRLQAYMTLLIQIGTSYEEIRRIQTAAEPEQKELAERLGLDRSDRLNALLLDPSTDSTQTSSNLRQPLSLTEEKLESLFGLVATAKPYGSAIAPPKEIKWQPDRTWRSVINHPNLNYVLPDLLQLFPDLLQWRLNYLQQQWQKTDWPADVQSTEEERDDTPPLIDPDIISPEHCRSETTRKIRRERQQWISSQLDGGSNSLVSGGLKNISGTHQVGLEQMIQEIWQDSQILSTLAQQRQQGHDITESLRSLNLTNAAFSYLVRMQELVASGSDLLDSEWDEVYNILIQVLKQRQFSEWRREEKRNKVTLSPQHFKIPKPIFSEFPPPKTRTANKLAWNLAR